jgi:post-segregation antitoxin (ccd killing protein)
MTDTKVIMAYLAIFQIAIFSIAGFFLSNNAQLAEDSAVLYTRKEDLMAQSQLLLQMSAKLNATLQEERIRFEALKERSENISAIANGAKPVTSSGGSLEPLPAAPASPPPAPKPKPVTRAS